MSPSQAQGDVRRVLFESTPRPGKPKLQVVLQRKTGGGAITFERGAHAGDPWLAIPIEQVAKSSRIFMLAYKTIFELQRHEDLSDVPFPIQLGILRRKTGASLSTVQELRICVDKWQDHPYITLTVLQQEGEAWVPTSQRITIRFVELEPVQTALNLALRITRQSSQGREIYPSPSSQFDEIPPPYAVREP